MPSNINVAVVGVSGPEHIKGTTGVGKSLLCNRFVRPCADEFIGEHCSVLSEIDFFGSPVINKDHWLYWGSRSLRSSENSSVIVRVVEQTEFLSDETYDTIAKSSKSEDYTQRCCRTSLRSPDKLMYVQKEQLGSENEFSQQLIPDGVINVDGFVIVWDVSRDVPTHLASMKNIIKAIAKTKKPVVFALTKSDEMIEISKNKFTMMVASSKDLKNALVPPIETSSLKNVNIDLVFQSLLHLCTRSLKSLEKPLSYEEEAKRVEQQNIQIKYAFTVLLSKAVPLLEWPHRYSNWQHALADIDRHPDHLNFISVFGSHVAFEMYERYAAEAKNLNILNRLRTFVPCLFEVFEKFEEHSLIADMDWETAQSYIISHDSFCELFYTLEKEVSSSGESQIPAEVLLLPEASHAFDEFKMSRQHFRYLSKLAEDLESFLDQHSDVYLDSTVEEVRPYIEDFCSINNVSFDLVMKLYRQYQEKIIEKTRNEILECTLEVLPSLANFWVEISAIDHGLINRYMIGSSTFRNQTKFVEIRDQVIKDCLVFLNDSSHTTCPSKENCLDLSISQRMFVHTELNNRNGRNAVQITGFCGDKLLLDKLTMVIQNTLRIAQNNYSSPNHLGILTSAHDLDMDFLEIEIRSYHSMWMSEVENVSGGQLLAYDGSRRASFEHAQAAIEKLCMINAPNYKAFVLLALVVDDNLYNELVTEGAELCESVGAKFCVFNVNSSYSFKEQVMDLLNLACEGEIEKIELNARPTTLMPNFSQSEFLPVSEKNDYSRKTSRASLDDKSLRVNFADPAVVSKFYQPVFDAESAPLATPESVDFSPIYSTVVHPLNVALYDTNIESGTKSKLNSSSSAFQTPVIQPVISCQEEHLSTISRRTPRISLSADSINRLHRTSNLYSSSLSSTGKKSSSTESLSEKVAPQKEQKTPNRFVRKVASSFRLKKNFLGLETGEKKDLSEPRSNIENILSAVDKKASRSLPQSPRNDRKAKVYSSINSTTGKVSNVLSWLPLKSSKILFKNKSATYDLSTSVSSFTTAGASTHGVILPNQSLRELSASSKTGIPAYVELCINFIEQNGGYEQEGLYRIPGNQTHLTELETSYLTSGKFEALHFDSPVHVAATALKNFFSCLPEALIEEKFHGSFKRIVHIEKVEDKLKAVTAVIERMRAENRNLLAYLIQHLYRASRSSKTAMDSHNLSKVWTPTLFRPEFTSYEELSSGIMAYQLTLEFLISFSETLFENRV